ncbi:phosphoribosylanthranilate isomerase [Reichenbachiella ulvae]|uniref:N-(5'-phosphoribosyl)anthranilate isomerase n=1 Tax=Reichenbachiella ulvae TaxID=2980104 RepID=A0ABT3CPP5_9BACT|nr:phosphoribosylanthranilate isomerase [Reichenbachiella ulvae]MCV9385434.1 phosphoribosylanthranilate isomerase [Reichenbachiella ulvae]
MEIKVCGIRNMSNLNELAQSDIDYIGFIFYERSKRYFLAGDIDESTMKALGKKKVGVFVNEKVQKIKRLAEQFDLDVLQLHGEESVKECEELKAAGYQVWKAFPVLDTLPDIQGYEQAVDAYLFDTKGKEHGGNGVQFDWSALSEYEKELPFVLSGGIGPNDVSKVKGFHHKALQVLDINSRFEVEPGLKDVSAIKTFISELKNQD